MDERVPIELHRDTVRPEWVDYNGHMNLAYYVLIFDFATDAFLDYVGIDQAFRERTHSSTFAAEIHVTYEHELIAGDEVRVLTRLLDYDAKRIHFFHEMCHARDGHLAATNELMQLYVDMQQRRVGVMPDAILDRLRQIMGVHSAFPRPPQVGRVMRLER